MTTSRTGEFTQISTSLFVMHLSYQGVILTRLGNEQLDITGCILAPPLSAIFHSRTNLTSATVVRCGECQTVSRWSHHAAVCIKFTLTWLYERWLFDCSTLIDP